MTRNEKLRKLGNAVREYRGVCTHDFSKWKSAPKTDKVERVRHWLTELKVDVQASLRSINECQTWEQFREWIKTL